MHVHIHIHIHIRILAHTYVHRDTHRDSSPASRAACGTPPAGRKAAQLTVSDCGTDAIASEDITVTSRTYFFVGSL